MPTLNPFCLSDAGSAAYNGTYSQISGSSSWQKVGDTSKSVYYNDDYGQWYITNGSQDVYYNNAGPAFSIPLTGWVVFGAGVAPVPTVTAGECGTPTPTPTPTPSPTSNTIRIKRSSTTTATPTSLLEGELAANITDKKIWIGDSTKAPILISDYNNAGGSGTVTSVGLTVPTGLSVANSPVTTAASLDITLTSGYSIPTTTSQGNWDTAYTNRITSLTTTGSSGSATLTTNTLNIPTYTLSGLGGQASSTNLTSLAGLTYASSSFVKMTAAGTFGLDTTAYGTATAGGSSGQFQYKNVSGGLSGATALTYQSVIGDDIGVYATSSSRIALVVQGAVSQSSNLFEARSSNGVVLLYITQAGGLNVDGGDITTSNSLVISNSSNGRKITISRPSTFPASYTLTLPQTAGSSNQALVTNGSGTLSWASVGSGTVTSIATTSPITGGTITGTGTIGINASSANTASYVVQRDASGNFSAGTITATLSGNASTATSATSATSATTATNLAGGNAGHVPYQSASGATSFLAAGTSGQVLQSNGSSAPSWASVATGMPTGAILPYAAISPPTGYLLCDGSAISRSTYSTLYSTIVPNRGTAAITIASPAVVTLSAHGFQTGDIIYLTTTGALPTGLAQNTLYYVINVTSSTFRLATSAANATAGTAINTSGTQSGTHTLFHCPYGLGNGSTTFNVPDMRSRVGVGLGQASGLTNRTLGGTVGTETETLTSSQIPSHSHPNTVGSTAGGTNNITSGMSANTVHNHSVDRAAWTNNGSAPYTFTGGGSNIALQNIGINNSASLDHTHNLFITNANNTGGGGSHNNMQPSIGLNYIIKT